MLDWDDVRVLLAVMRARNLHEAAAQLRVDRSTISRRLAALEKTLGARLFGRTREGLRPTSAALRLRPHAETIEAEVLALRSAAARGDERLSGTVRVASTETMATLLVERGLLDVADAHPGLTVELLAGNRQLDVARGEADLAIRFAPLRQASLKVRCLARSKVGLFASPAYLQVRGLPRGVDALAGHDVLLPGGELAAMPEAKWLAARRGVRVALRSNCLPALMAAAVAGRGLIALALGFGDQHAGLQRVVVLEQLPARPVWLVTREGDGERAVVRVVADRIAAIFARAS